MLLDRALEHLWFKKGAEYQGRKYTQNELWQLLVTKTTPDVLMASVEFLGASKEPVRSPVAYLGKCILGVLVNGIIAPKGATKVVGGESTGAGEKATNAGEIVNGKSTDIKNPSEQPAGAKKSGECLDGMNGRSSFDVDDFFSAAMRNSYGDDFKF